MTEAVFSGVRIRGISGVVPATRIDNLVAHPELPEAEKQKTIKLTGIHGYRRAGKEVCASDLCQEAAELLFGAAAVSSHSVDAIIFVSQTPDYRLPATACVLQHKLSCSKEALAFDVNLGCSGFIYGLYIACSMIRAGGVKRALLLCGDTQSKLSHEGDRNVSFIMGDAGTATILDAEEGACDIGMILRTDGSRSDKLMVPAGGFRMPSTDKTRALEKQADGGVRSQEHIHMNGMEIFNFSVTDVVQTLRDFMTRERIAVEDTDYLFLHQANKFMTDKIARKLGFPSEKVPYSLGEFGNTSCASIPLTIAHHFSNMKHKEKKRCILSGFGVGLSWGVVDITFENLCCPPIEEL